MALERQIWLENTEKEDISLEIVRIARRLDKKRRAVAAREDKAFRAGAREAAQPLRDGAVPTAGRLSAHRSPSFPPRARRRARAGLAHARRA